MRLARFHREQVHADANALVAERPIEAATLLARCGARRFRAFPSGKRQRPLHKPGCDCTKLDASLNPDFGSDTLGMQVYEDDAGRAAASAFNRPVVVSTPVTIAEDQEDLDQKLDTKPTAADCETATHSGAKSEINPSRAPRGLLLGLSVSALLWLLLVMLLLLC